MRVFWKIQRLFSVQQSPILVNSTTSLAPAGSVILDVPYARDVDFENIGTNVEVIMNGTLQAGNESWTLSQFHFHTPSEHRLGPFPSDRLHRSPR